MHQNMHRTRLHTKRSLETERPIYLYPLCIYMLSGARRGT